MALVTNRSSFEDAKGTLYVNFMGQLYGCLLWVSGKIGLFHQNSTVWKIYGVYRIQDVIENYNIHIDIVLFLDIFIDLPPHHNI